MADELDDRPAWYRDEAERIKRLQVVLLVVIAALLVVFTALGALLGPGPWIWAVLPLLIAVGIAHYYLTFRRLRFSHRARREGIRTRYERRHVWGSIGFAAFSALLGLVMAAQHQYGIAVLGLVGAALLTANAVKAHRNLAQR